MALLLAPEMLTKVSEDLRAFGASHGHSDFVTEEFSRFIQEKYGRQVKAKLGVKIHTGHSGTVDTYIRFILSVLKKLGKVSYDYRHGTWKLLNISKSSISV